MTKWHKKMPCNLKFFDLKSVIKIKVVPISERLLTLN